MMRVLGVVVRRTWAFWAPRRVSYADQARIWAAMQNAYPQTPAHGPAGEGSPWVGQTPEGEDVPPAPVVAVEAATKTASPSGPTHDDLPTYRPHPCHRWEFADNRLAVLVDRWGGLA